MRRTILLSALLAIVLLGSSCQTIAGFWENDPPPPAVFQGIRRHINTARDLNERAQSWWWIFGPFMIVDVPLCFALDTVLLPITVPWKLLSNGQDTASPSAVKTSERSVGSPSETP